MRRLTLLAAIIAPLALASSASAAVSTERESVAMPLTQGPVSTVSAKCPRGSNLVSGSWKATAGVASVIESRRVGRRGWRVTAGRFTNDLTPSVLTALAHCDPGASRATAVTETVNGNDQNETAGVTSRCPGRKRAIAGGFHILAPSVTATDAFVSGSFRKGRRSWRTEIYPFGSVTTTEGIAYCASLDEGLRKRSATASEEDRQIDVRTPRCRATSSVGFRAANTPEENPIAVDRLIRKRNRGVAHAHDVDGAGLSLRIFAYCPRS